MAGEVVATEVTEPDGAEAHALANLAQYADEARGAFAKNTERACPARRRQGRRCSRFPT